MLGARSEEGPAESVVVRRRAYFEGRLNVPKNDPNLESLEFVQTQKW